MKKVRPLIEALAAKHDFQLGVPNSAMLVHAASQGEGEYQRGELLLTVWNNWLRYSVGRVVFGGGVRKRMGFTVWFDAEWQPQQAVNDLAVELTNMELAELDMAELIEAIYLPSDTVEKWRQAEDVTIPPRKPRLVVPQLWDTDKPPIF